VGTAKLVVGPEERAEARKDRPAVAAPEDRPAGAAAALEAGADGFADRLQALMVGLGPTVVGAGLGVGGSGQDLPDERLEHLVDDLAVVEGAEPELFLGVEHRFDPEELDLEVGERARRPGLEPGR
jgi:hypothetical protein